MEALTRFGNDVMVWGRNATIGTSFEELYAYDQAMEWATQFAAAAALDVTSSSVTDASANQGAKTIRIIGIDGNFKIVYADVTMNGQTIVTTTQTFLRVFGAEVKTAGTSLSNVGDIHIVKTGTGGSYTTGVPGTVTSAACKILIGWGSSFNGLFTVPAGMTYQLIQVNAACRAQACTLIVQEQELGVTTPPQRVVWSTDLQPATLSFDMTPMRIAFGEKTDVRMRILAAGASGIAHCSMVLKRMRG
jgi:hypothetical protein